VGAAFAVLIVACFVVCLAVPRIGVMTELFPGAWRGLWREKNGLGGSWPSASASCRRRPC
jgi:exopolysaccharide production protein ExoQ